MSSRIISPELEGQVLDAVLRSHFPSFLRKVFSTLSPGQTFESGWAVEAMAYQIERSRSSSSASSANSLARTSRSQPAFSVSLLSAIANRRFCASLSPTALIVGTVSSPSSFAAASRPCPARITSSSSTTIG
jgi:hypothetical protein